MKYFLAKNVSQSYDDAITAVTEALKGEGFGVLTEIDVAQTLKKSSMSISQSTRSLVPATQILPTKRSMLKIRLAFCCPATSSSRSMPMDALKCLPWTLPLRCRPLAIANSTRSRQTCGSDWKKCSPRFHE